MSAAMRVVIVLCVLQARLWLVHCQHNQTQLGNSEVKPQCNSSPTFVTKSHTYFAVVYSFLRENNASITIEYGTPLTVTCISANATSLYMTRNGVNLQPVDKGVTSITWSTEAQNESRSEFVCTDSETACNLSVFVAATPAFNATLPNREYSNREYIMPYGNLMSLTCSGPDAARLIITKDGKKILTEKESETTIKWVGIPDLQRSEYSCIDVDTTYRRSERIKVVPAVYVRSRNETITQTDFDSDTHVYSLKYGDSIEIYCSGPQSVTLIDLEDNEEMLTEYLNKNTVKSFTGIPKLGKSSFGCIDSAIPAYISKVRLEVTPRIEVMSRNIRRVGDKYVMKHGDPLKIICSGPNAEKLTLFKERSSVYPEVRTVNRTTVKLVINKPDIHERFFDSDTYICGAGEAKSRVVVKIDALPAAADFRCISHNLEYLNCTWTSTRDSANFTLFYIANGNYERICSKRQMWSGRSRFCIWYRDDYPGYSFENQLSFLMQSCNDLGCTNQTFLIDHLSILKPDPPQGLTVHTTSSQSAVLRWTVTEFDVYLRSSEDRGYEYKLEYCYSDVAPIKVNGSPVCRGRYYCEVELTLPCPGQLYQVRVYQKLKKAAGEEFWSDPSSVSFQTDADDEPGVFYSTCLRKPI